MQVRYHIDPTTGLPQIYKHNVSEGEVEDILGRPLQDIRGRDDSRIAIGQTGEGRYIKGDLRSRFSSEFRFRHNSIRTGSESEAGNPP